MLTNTHPTLPEFEYVQPETLTEASQFLTQHTDNARLLMGGTDILVRLRDGILSPKFLVDVKNLEGMQDLRFDPQIGLTIGAAVSMNRVIASPEVQRFYPLLAEACRQVASYQLRTRATIAGNFCTASPAGDSIGACLALDATLQIYSQNGLRQESLANFFLGPGKTILKSGDIVTAIHLPLPPAGAVGTYRKLGRNKLGSLSIVGVTVLGSPDPGLPAKFRFRIVLGAVAPVPLVAAEAEACLAGQTITPEVIRQAAGLASKACAPIDDIRASARYRRLMVRNETEIALTAVWKELLHQA
jgi:carbon-monoxide dehydrogenase medium subunit